MNDINKLDVGYMIVSRPDVCNKVATVTIFSKDGSMMYDYVVYKRNSEHYASLWNLEFPSLTREYKTEDSLMTELCWQADCVFAYESVDRFTLKEGCFLWNALVAKMIELENEE